MGEGEGPAMSGDFVEERAQLFGIALVIGVLGYGVGTWRAEARLVEPPSLDQRQEAAFYECFAKESHRQFLRLDSLQFDGRMTDSAPTDSLAAAEEACQAI